MKGLLTTLSLLFSAFLLGQHPHLRHFGVDEGLPSSHVYRVMQDSKGYLWICTDKGIVRFDGYHFETYGTKDNLPYNDFWEAKEDSKGRIWFSSYAGYFVHYDYTDRKFHIKENKTKSVKKSQPANASVEDENGAIWYSCHGNLFNVDKDTFEQQYTFESRHRFSKEFICHEKGIYANPIFLRFFWKKHVNDTQITYKDSFIYTYSGIAFLNENSYLQYNSLAKELYYCNPRYKKKISISELSPHRLYQKQAIGLYVINESEILVNTHLESFVIDTNLRRVPEYDFLQKWDINSICADREDNRWICTKNDGLYLLTADAARTHTFRLTMDKDIRAITADKTNQIWAGTSKGEVFQLLADSVKELTFRKPNKVNIRDMIVTSTNTLLIAFETYNIFYPLSLLALNSEMIEINWANYKETFDCKIDPCKIAFFYRDMNKVMLTNESSFRNFYLKKDGDILFPDPLHNKYAILSEKENRVEYSNFNTKKRTTACVEAKIQPENTWVGSTVGLFFYWKNTLRLDSIISLKAKYPILSQTILDMAVDSQGNIWIGTDGFGLYRVQSKERPDWKETDFQLFEVKELTGKIIKSVFVDSRNHIWLATNQGAFEVVMTQEGNTPQAKVKRYSIAQGVPTNEVNCIYVNQNHIYIGTPQGLTKIPIKIVNASKWLAPLDLQVKINGKDTPLNSSIELSYTENNLSFNFVCLSFKSDKNITYSYRMLKNGKNTEWQATTETYKDFPLLTEGDYIFEVKAEDINGQETAIQKTEFSISPPWWRNYLFQGILFFAFLGSIFAIYRWQVRELKRVSQLELTAEQTKAQINLERAENLEIFAKYQKQIADLEGKTLLSQMNPHFIFNVLTSIQSFVLNNEPYISHDYLTRFAKLIRSFLDASREKYISIEKEFELLKNYIELEQLRFNHLFKADISIDPNTDPNIEIPPMFIQPFVENAINHGLKYKGGNGHLRIHFSEESDSNLLCIIEDDGVGRQKAKELQSNALRGHRSLALQIIQERIKLLSDIENWHIKLNFIDKEDKEGNSLGTRVELRFPFR